MISRLRSRIIAPAIAVLLGLAGLVPASAPALAQTHPLKAEQAFQVKAERSGDGTLALDWRIAPGTYLYRESLAASLAGASIALAAPAGQMKDDPNFGPVEIYHHRVEARASGLPPEGALEVSFQGCAEAGICYPVMKRQVDLATLVVTTPSPRATGGAASPVAPALSMPAASPPEAASPETASAEAVPAAARTGVLGAPPDTSGAGAAVRSASLAALLGTFFGFGLLLAFTPCVFPMLPILSGILAGGGAPPSPARGLALAAAYGLAMAAAYGLLGVAAAWSGANLQAALQAPWVIGIMAMLFLALAGAMLGLFDLAMPAVPARWMPRGNRGTLAGAAGLGFASALVVGPCVTPPLAAAMLHAAQTADAARGGAALFMLGLGMAAPLVAVGAFGVQILPRSGPWLIRVKQACGVMFIAVAAYLVSRILPDAAGIALFGILAMALGVFLGGLDTLGGDSGALRRLGKSAGLVCLVGGVLLLVGATGGARDPLQPLAFLSAPAPSRQPLQEVRVATPAAFDAARADAAAAGRTTLVSFTAAWCTVCKSNAAVIADPVAAARMSGLSRIAADVTAYGEDARALMSRFDVIGPPTLLLLDPAGREVPGSRHIGALSAADLGRLAAKAGL